jgi:FixJ family two-component response regulator
VHALVTAVLLRMAGLDALDIDPKPHTDRRVRPKSELALAKGDPLSVPGCVVTDLVKTEMSGLRLQRALGAREYCPPIVFFTGQGDINAVAQAMRAGAVAVLCKPVQAEDLLAAVREALERDAELRAKLALRHHIRGLMDKLTPPERVVLEHVVAGLPNKVIAARIGRAERTVKLHKKSVMEKMRVRSAVALLQLLVEGDMAPALTRDAFLAIGLTFSAVAAAADFDGSAPLTCTPKAAVNCKSDTGKCEKRKPESPPPRGGLKMGIDVANKTIKTPYRTESLPIQNSAVNNEQLILRGTD